jgi:hypothetical protein
VRSVIKGVIWRLFSTTVTVAVAFILLHDSIEVGSACVCMGWGRVHGLVAPCELQSRRLAGLAALAGAHAWAAGIAAIGCS